MVDQKQSQIPMGRATPGRPTQHPVAQPTLTPKEIMGMLRRHVLLIVSMTLLGLFLGGGAWFLLRKYRPTYTAKTVIKVLPPIEKDPTVIGGGQVSKEIQYGYRFTIASMIMQQRTLQELIKRDKIQETEWFKSFGQTKSKRLQKAVRDLKKHFSAYAHRDGEFVVLSMSCYSDTESALIVNEMMRLFLVTQGGVKQGEVRRKLTALQDQLGRIQRDLNSAERGLDDIRADSGFGDLKGQRAWRDTLTVKLDALELEKTDLMLAVQQIHATIRILKRQAAGPVGHQVGRQIENDPIMLNLASQAASLEVRLASTLTKFGENHRVVRQTKELINKTRQERQLRKAEIAEQVRRANLQNAQDQLTQLMTRLEALEKMRAEAAKRQADLNRARVLYEKQLAIKDERKLRLNETKAQIEKLKIMLEDPQTPKVQFVAEAPKPLEISFPKWQMFFPGGIMLGLCIGVGLVFLIEMLNDLVRTPRDVVRYLRIPLLGVVPDAAEDDQVEDINLCHVVRQAPYSLISEAYRRFRTNLKLAGDLQNPGVLLVTSGIAQEGKTSVVVNLATAFVAEGKKVLVIDANFWRPNLHKIFPNHTPHDQQAQQPDAEQIQLGLSTLLAGLCGYQEVIRTTGIKGLDVINSGMLPSNPAELLGGDQMEKLIKHQNRNYDYVIIDGPPVLLVSVVKVLASLVDKTLLVFNCMTTRRGAALRSIRELREVNAEITGCVLMCVKAMKGGYFSEQFKSQQEYQKLQLAHSV